MGVSAWDSDKLIGRIIDVDVVKIHQLSFVDVGNVLLCKSMFFSTAGFEVDLDHICKSLLSSGVSNIELSSGRHYNDIEGRLQRLVSFGASLQLHNYFQFSKALF